MSESMKVFFPQWQGSGRGMDLHSGAFEIRNHYFGNENIQIVDVDTEVNLRTKNGILGYEPILQQLQKAVDLLSTAKPQKTFTIGGDCGVELAPVSYLNQRYDGDLAVIWLDAHGDLNMPASSPSGHFHGMPLRCLMGEGDDGIVRQCFSVLEPDQVLLAGTRDLDASEEQYIRKVQMRQLGPQEMTDGDTLADAVRSLGKQHVYIHLDLDVLDPECFPSVLCPSALGVSMNHLLSVMGKIQSRFSVVGFSMLEYAKRSPVCLDKLKPLVEFGCGL